MEMDLSKLRWELVNLLQRNEEEKQNLASVIDNFNAAVRDFNRVATDYKDLLEQNASLLNSAVETLARYSSSVDDDTEPATTSAQPRSTLIPPAYPQEHISSTFDSTEIGSEICEASDSKSYKYQVELLAVERNADEGVQRCFYKPLKSPPPAPKKKLRLFESATSLLNKVSQITQDANDIHVRIISEYTDQDRTEKQFKYPYQLANGPKDELFVTDRECHQLIIFDAKLQPLCIWKTRPGRGNLLQPHWSCCGHCRIVSVCCRP